MTRPDTIRLHRGTRKMMMGRRRKQIVIGLGLSMLMGLAVYLRLWTIDYKISTDEAEQIRRQFDLANREAMDESAYWRGRYDVEAEKVLNCQKELAEAKRSIGVEDAGMSNKLESLRKENNYLLEKIESLKQELEAERLKCSRG